MFSTTLLTITLALLASVQGISVTSPSTSTVQSAGSALQLSWQSVSTDPTSFAVVLVNQNAEFLSNSPVTLIANQSTAAGSTSLSYPSGSWPAGTGFQVNLVKSTNEINSILVQSGMFNITSSGTASSSASSSSASSASSSSVASSSSSSSAGATIIQSSASAVYSGNAKTSDAIPPAQTGSTTSGAISLGVNGAMAVVVGALALGIAL